MKSSTTALAVLVLVLLALGSAVFLFERMNTGNQTSTSTRGIVTLADIMDGRFPSAIDKNGTDGVWVTVRSLTVLYVMNETDGDWHVAVSDGNVSVFITEITPAYQDSLGRPTAGTVIDETGAVYCDTAHQNEAWHGYTCWEIHPVTAWKLSA